MDQGPRLLKNFADMKCKKVDDTFGLPLEDEAVEVEHLLAEPKSDNISVDGVLCSGKENPVKCLGMEEFSCGIEYGFAKSFGGLDANNIRGEYDLRLDVLDGLLDDVDEVDDVHAAHDLSTACEDFLLDIEFTDKVSEFDCGLRGGSNLANSSSESHSPGFSGSSNGAIGISESSTETLPDSERKNDSHDQSDTCEVHQTFKSECACKAPVKGSIHLTSKDLQNLDELEDDEKPLVSFILSNIKGKKSVRAAKLGTYLKQKRLRKPTCRYVEEFSKLKSGCLISGEKIPIAASNDNCVKVRSDDELPHTGALKLGSRQESLSGSSQAPSESRVRRGRPRKSTPRLVRKLFNPLIVFLPFV